jgi:hypothetical protein
VRAPIAPPSAAQALALRRQVALTFPLAFLLHDLEELLGTPHWQRTGPALLRRRFPRLPPRAVDLAVPDTRQMAIAIGVVAGGVAAASGWALAELARARDAAATDGAAPEPGVGVGLLRSAVTAFGLHAVSHLASAAAVRGYTPGVATTPVVVVPWSLWAWRTLRASGLAARPGEAARLGAQGAVSAAGLVIGGQLLGRALTRRGPGRPG